MKRVSSPDGATVNTTIDDKVAFLSQPGSHTDSPERVEVVETHFAWIFLSKQFAYKLKKPIKFHELDFSTLAKRRYNCDLELRLNARLAEAVYIGVVPLTRVGSGGMELGGHGEPLEWLVKMHRLPRNRMLDRLALNDAIGKHELEKVLEKLAAFYARTDRAPFTGAQYRRMQTQQIRRFAAAMIPASDGIDMTEMDALVDSQIRFIEQNESLLDARIAEHRVVDAHGDLKPEHIYVSDNPQIIDCLEFSAELRLLDTAEELSFLDLECERLGNAPLGRRIRSLYESVCDDPLDESLYEFYRSKRCLARALVSAWHLQEGVEEEERRYWSKRARWYIASAQASIAAALS
jgi:aminoglycoside phosphotransferase family enzyme